MAEHHAPALSVIDIPGVDNWQSYSFRQQPSIQENGPYTQKVFQDLVLLASRFKNKFNRFISIYIDPLAKEEVDALVALWD